jgi:hypothetical protein
VRLWGRVLWLLGVLGTRVVRSNKGQTACDMGRDQPLGTRVRWWGKGVVEDSAARNCLVKGSQTQLRKRSHRLCHCLAEPLTRESD